MFFIKTNFDQLSARDILDRTARASPDCFGLNPPTRGSGEDSSVALRGRYQACAR